MTLRLFIEDHFAQLSKIGHRHCGDLWIVSRTDIHTWVILADGLGSGIPANLSATLTTEHFLGMIREGFVPSEAIKGVLRALHTARTKGGPWAAFSAARFSHDGEILVYCYESPPPLLLTIRGIEELNFQPQYWEGEVVLEGVTHLRMHEAMLFFSDGVINAGLGGSMPRGWGENGLRRFLASSGLAQRKELSRIPQTIVREAASISQLRPADDITAGVILLRRPRILQVLTGPPGKREDTTKVMEQFTKAEGAKAVCGGTTTFLLAKHLGVVPVVHPEEFGAPAYYELPGVNLACEGVITLNRTFNIFDEPNLDVDAGHGVTSLLELLLEADEIYFWVGQAINKAQQNTLKPAGLLPRQEIIEALAKKLRNVGKMAHIMRM
ncbi:MAG TPA: SpoIIE family protein phosphatase [Candidatus Limnocylindrales bacterium]|nr:SpoIIE family protein phosphatase [Candidatus Limnocylindrales bacterium]